MNGLNIPARRQRLSDCIKMQDPAMSLPISEAHFKYKDRSEGWEKKYYIYSV